MSGGELFDQIADEDNKMTEGDVVRYVRQVCDGISHMHDQNIVHLDIKVSFISSPNDYLLTTRTGFCLIFGTDQRPLLEVNTMQCDTIEIL